MPRPAARRSPKRPAKAGVQIAFRASTALAEALDREVARLLRRRPGAVIHRSDVAREILGRALLPTRPKRPRAA